MRFTPGQTVQLYHESGAVIVARPFFYVEFPEKGVQVELYEDHPRGRPLTLIDEANGVYCLDGSPAKLFLCPPDRT